MVKADILHRHAASEFGARVFRRAGYRDHFKRPEFHSQNGEAAIHMQKRTPQRAVPKHLLDGIEKLAGRIATQHGVTFGKVIEVQKGRDFIVFRALASRK